jgi:DNA-binding Xre family transcriptional regulator
MKLNLKNILKDKQIKQPVSFLEKNGFPPHVALRLLKPKTDRIQHKELLLLCRVLFCTPNDLFILEEADIRLIHESHPLSKLKPRDGKLNLLDKLRKMPMEQLDELNELIDKKNGTFQQG